MMMMMIVMMLAGVKMGLAHGCWKSVTEAWAEPTTKTLSSSSSSALCSVGSHDGHTCPPMIQWSFHNEDAIFFHNSSILMVGLPNMHTAHLTKRTSSWSGAITAPLNPSVVGPQLQAIQLLMCAFMTDGGQPRSVNRHAYTYYIKVNVFLMETKWKWMFRLFQIAIKVLRMFCQQSTGAIR